MRFKIDITPMGAVRMTTRGKFVKKNAKKYLQYKEAIRWTIKQQFKGKPIDGAVGVTVWFYMPMPETWSKKKKAEMVNRYHTKKPDIDNLIKGLFDALNNLIWVDDNRVVDMTVFKVYGEKPGIEIEVEEVEERD